jgi:glycosyltransferase involved in cell wall biosynthesis
MEARGTNEYIVHLARELLRRDKCVAVFCGPGPMLDLLKERDIPAKIFEHLGQRGFRGEERRRFFTELEAHDPQVIHVQPVRLARLLKQVESEVEVPIVLTLHAPPGRGRSLRSVLPRVAGIIATSQAVREELVNEYGVEKTRITVIHNGIDVEALARLEVRPIFQGGTPAIGCVGPVEKARGHELFVRAAAGIARAGKNYQFVVAGEGEQLPRLRRLATEQGLDECLTFVGNFSSYSEVLDALDVVVQSAQVQVSGFSILDAMGRGRPVIAFNTGTACEIIENGKTGLLVPMDEVDKLAGAMEDLAESPNRARRIGEAARRSIAEDYNIRTVAESILRYYARILSEK